MIARIYIVDDEAPARARLMTVLSDISDSCAHLLVGHSDRPQAALDGIQTSKPDIILLDVQMPGMSGLEMASHLRHLGAAAPSVIFVTAYDAYALKAFEVHAADYLVKPVRAERLAEAINRVMAQRASLGRMPATPVPERRRHFAVQERGRLLLVPIRDVLYLKAEQKYVTLRTKTREHLIEESLVSIEEDFGDVFLRVHRNALVARDAVIGVERAVASAAGEGDAERGYDGWEVLMRDTTERLPISRRQWQAVKSLIR